MKEPVEPSKEDCCSSGCNPCIFDVYEKQLLLYKKFQEGGEVSQTVENAISLLQYTQFTVINNIKLSENHHLLIFKLKYIVNNSKVLWKPGYHFLIKYKSGESSCTRAYTPVKYMLQSDSEFSIIVKSYNDGIVSQYLCDLKIGQETLWRGPYGSYEITTNKFNRIIMIAQGTGVAPFFSIIESILQNEDDMTKLILHYCCKSEESILFREELYSWKEYWNFTYIIYLSSGNQTNGYKYREPVVNHKLDAGTLLSLKPFSANDQILLCGSTKFMDHYKNILRDELENILLF